MLTPTNRHPARHRAQLTASDLSVMRGVTPVLNHVDLVVTPSSRVAIVGENGRGKTTLLHALAGTLPPDSGTIQRIGALGLAEQEMNSTDNRTVGQAVAEAIAEPLAALAALDAAAAALADGSSEAAEQYAAALEGADALNAWDAERRVQIALEALDAETDMTRLLADLSVGQRYRVRLACLLGAEDDFLLLDEPTNHLDRSGLEFLTAQLRARKGGVVIVSHDRALLSDIAETVVDLDPTPDDRPRIYGNGYAGYREGRLADRERWEQEYERQQQEQARLQDSLSAAQNRLVSGWRPEKGSPKHGRATRAGGLVQSVHRRQEALRAHAVTVPEPPQLFQFPDLPTRKGAVLLNVDNVSLAERLTQPVSFELSHRSRLVVTGPNGAGKSTLLSIAAGELLPNTGTVRTSRGTRLGFLRQESVLPPDRRANEVYARHIDELVAQGNLQSSEAVGLSGLGLLRSREAGKRVGELSMGQQRRLDLALMLATRPHVLLLDEPTNHLSIALVDELTEALGATQAAVVLSTHDRQLLRDVAEWPHCHLSTIAERSALV
ncbi:ABC-F family ATP-binding cassette domain-containing protein [Leucobacter denitrificans]|uniref:ABC-F family ATP-binding cassette domain-containing protein n=1 Tax=Leucobacter denitrificans TaxID=683042 RepID=A0A7G9S2E7_9MICO|nr:ABC-F family ATP-binding cassette domain-containing protein [Leucobacter denitrificans]QNN62022.1 ABC-F family ATP-binding cassette domain-containing protein [Leucobacter denitrificans]